MQFILHTYVLFTCVIIFLSPAHDGSRATPPCGIIASTPEKSLPANRRASYGKHTATIYTHAHIHTHTSTHLHMQSCIHTYSVTHTHIQTHVCDITHIFLYTYYQMIIVPVVAFTPGVWTDMTSKPHCRMHHR